MELKDKILLALAILSLVFISLLIGNFIYPFTVLLPVIIVISAGYQAVKDRSIKKEILPKVRNTAYTIIYSLLLATLIATVLPYLIFHRSFVSIYIFQYAYSAPVLFVFFFALSMIGSMVSGEIIKLAHSMKVAIVVTLIISLLVSLSIMAIIDYSYYDIYRKYWDGENTYAHILNNATLTAYMSDLPVYQEIGKWGSDYIKGVCSVEGSACDAQKHQGLCIDDGCINAATDMAYKLVKDATNIGIYASVLHTANKELNFTNSPHPDGFGLDTYLAELENNISSSGIILSGISDADKALMSKLDSDFNYDDYNNLFRNYQDWNEPQLVSGQSYTTTRLSESGSLYEVDAPFYNGNSYAFTHTVLFRDIFAAIYKMLRFTDQQRRSPDVILKLYENRTISEPVESKIIRDKIILYQIGRNLKSR